MLRYATKRIFSGILVLLAITYLAFLTQSFALRSRFNHPAPLAVVAGEAWEASVDLWQGLPQGDLGRYTTPTGPWRSNRAQPLNEMLLPLMGRSLALLVAAIALGGLVGGIIGVLAAASRRPGISLLMMTLSIIGIATPSFFLGMLLQYGEILIYRHTGIQLVPVGGFGWDRHIILPMMVLAARPIAQIARLTYVRVADILEQDYVRTAHAKGLMKRSVWWLHIIRNVSATVLTAMGTSLRFSLSSLPVVEVLFGWPGAGKAMLDMLQTSQTRGATVLVLCMGAFFVGINILLDLLYRWLDPRLREAESKVRLNTNWAAWIAGLADDWFHQLAFWRKRNETEDRTITPANGSPEAEDSDTQQARARLQHEAKRRVWRQATLGNPALMMGALIGLFLVVLVVAGPSMAPHNAFSTALILDVDGVEMRPPVAPNSTFPMGTDGQGRDILSLLLVGARRTLTMALFAVAARLAVGGLLGFLAGWFEGSRLDRAIMGVAEALASFPALLLAMLVVYAVGVQQGIRAFVIALAIVGWGEVMQTVRSEVMRIKPMEYIESAIATGLGQGQILTAHVLPNVWPTMISLAFLEMGGVLMLLGELGFLGVFIGGGLGADGTDAMPSLTYYDIPEWSVMLANSWKTFRSYPWATLYPALAFFVAILGFTLLGEGFRWLSEGLTLTFRGLLNRYTVAAVLVLGLGAAWMFNSTNAYASYQSRAEDYDTTRVMEDIGWLTDPSYNGRRAGTEDADLVAERIADEFRALGLQSCGDEVADYYQRYQERFRVLTDMPTLTLYGPNGQTIEAVYGKDFVHRAGPYDIGGSGSGELVAVGSGGRYIYSDSQAAVKYGLTSDEMARDDRVLLEVVPGSFYDHMQLNHVGWLTMDTDAVTDMRYDMLAKSEQFKGDGAPALVLADELVAYMLDEIGLETNELVQAIEDDQAYYIPTGWRADMAVPAEHQIGVPVRNVLAFWPGKDMLMDSDAIIIAAHYDGLGRLPDGTLYPGANDNASGVATMFELIRTLQESDFVPKRTLIFCAWVGGEFHNAVEFDEFLEARLGFREAYTIRAGIQIEGVGAGTGDKAVLWHTSSERLTQVIQKAARRMDTPLTTSAQGLHADPEVWPRPSKSLPSATISWAGADDLAHRPTDSIEQIDEEKLDDVGRMLALTLMVLANDASY